MRTTVTIDDAQLAKARQLSGISETSALVRESLKMLIEWESSRRLALMGGSQPELKPVRHRRAWLENA